MIGVRKREIEREKGHKNNKGKVNEKMNGR